MDSEPISESSTNRIVRPGTGSSHSGASTPTIGAQTGTIEVPSDRKDGHPGISALWTDPHTLRTVVATATVLCGTGMLAIAGTAPSTTEAMPSGMRSLWMAGLVLAGILGMAGAAWRGEFAVGLALRLGSLILLATTASMYAISLFAGSGAVAAHAGTSVAAVAVVSCWSAGQIARDLAGLRWANRHPIRRTREDVRRSHTDG